MIKRRVRRKEKKESIVKGKKLIGSKCIFKQKKNGVYRARLVALGYSQIPSADFIDNFAPVVIDKCFRIMIVLAFIMLWEAKIVDIETAFLEEDLDVKIFMKI